MSINSKQKGNRFEREVAKMLSKKFDVDVKRTMMSGALSFKGDVICINQNSILSDFTFELKNVERLNIWKALEQARNDSPIGKYPVVVFTKNHESEYAAIPFEDWMNLVKEVEELRSEIKNK